MDERVRTESILRQSESRHAFVLELGAALRPLTDPLDIQAAACRMLGQHLGADRVIYFQIRDGDYVIERDYYSHASSIRGRHPAASFGPRLLEAYLQGRVAVSEDVASDITLSPQERSRYQNLQIAAHIGVPLMKQGQFVAGLAVHSCVARAWSLEEVALVEETAERTWSSVVRARAEDALAQSEERYRTLFTNIDEAFCVCELLYDEQGRPFDRRLIESNARYHELVGTQFAIGATARMVLPNLDNYWFERCHEALVTGQSQRFVHDVAHLARHYDVYLSRVGGEGSRVYIAVFHDITDRQRREANLEFLADVGRDLVTLTSARDAMQLLGARIGRHLQVAGCAFAAVDEVQGRAQVLYEWQSDGVDSIRGEYVMDDFLGEGVRGLLREGREVAKGNVLGDSGVQGERFAALGIGAFVCVPVVSDGNWQAFLFVYSQKPRQWRRDEIDLLRELTVRLWARLERARAEEALREREQQLRRGAELLHVLIDRSPTGFYIVDSDLRISHMNADSQARAFRNVNPAIGRRLDDALRVLWPEPLASEVIERFRHTLETGEPYLSPGLDARRVDLGVVETYDWQLQRITMPDGRHAVVCYYYDTTTLRQIEYELRETDRRKDEFLATLAHELRNPLAPIRNAMHYFRRLRLGGPEAERMHQMMDRQFSHLVRLVDDLLEVSRITRGKVELRLERTELGNVLGSALETSRPVIEEHGQQLTTADCAERLPLYADPIRLTQVFANLLNNAAKYTRKGGRIWVETRREGAFAVVTVRDDGKGIPAAMLDSIFDIFTQVDAMGGHTHGGLGIGLTLVRSIVNLHGGSVVAHSDGPGMGSEFVVRLPLSEL